MRCGGGVAFGVGIVTILCQQLFLIQWLCGDSSAAVAEIALNEFLKTTNISATLVIQSFDMDEHWKTETLIERQGYPNEVHKVITKDNYVLTLHRIPKVGHQPVLLAHGLYGSATDFVIMGKNISLAFALWNEHYDVWIANFRGSNASQEHREYTAQDLQFWNFSLHELGNYDLPAFIDYIRSNTSFHDMQFVGHSQGATALLVMAALRPTYNDKISLAQLLAPLSHMQHLRVSHEYLSCIEEFLKDSSSRRIGEFLPRGFLRQFNCLLNKFLHFSCLQMIFEIVGHDMVQFEQGQINLLFSQLPAGGSVKQLRHLQQIYQAGTFQLYNYGYEGNYDKYAAPTPPKYNLSSVNIPIVLHYGANDLLSTAADIKVLHKQLPRVLNLNLVPYADFNHMDFIWAKELKVLLNDKVLQIFKNYKIKT